MAETGQTAAFEGAIANFRVKQAECGCLVSVSGCTRITLTVCSYPMFCLGLKYPRLSSCSYSEYWDYIGVFPCPPLTWLSNEKDLDVPKLSVPETDGVIGLSLAAVFSFTMTVVSLKHLVSSTLHPL